MSFRRQADDFFAWRLTHRNQLIELGMPEVVVDDHKRFILAVQNGDDFESDWDQSWVRDEHVRQLYALLRERFTDVGWELPQMMERRCL